jgi:hypothetical protein
MGHPKCRSLAAARLVMTSEDNGAAEKKKLSFR